MCVFFAFTSRVRARIRAFLGMIFKRAHAQTDAAGAPGHDRGRRDGDRQGSLLLILKMLLVYMMSEHVYICAECMSVCLFTFMYFEVCVYL